MKSTYFGYGAAALALGAALCVMPGKIQGQGPLYDRVDVNLPYTITIGNQTLQPGEYVIQQLNSASGDSRVLLIYSDNGMKFQTSAMTIPCLDPNTARDTKVMLHHFGNDYYFDKIWIQGKDYGYEFPLPNSVKQREKEEMQPVSVAANYSSTPAPAETATTKQETTTAAQQPTTAAQEATTAAQQPTTMRPATQQQATMPPATQQAQTVAPNNEANREEAPPTSMPKTSADWVLMLLSGGTLSGLGLALRRKR
jgi:hypothetical protein